ncbi:MAG: trypsin-like peptidase domain-containing protein [Bacteroidales bacterium]|nr:trypsin-like peptidase domain-containing protein [Bacteroidales bacterium]
MKSKYKTYNNASVVAVSCGSSQGTGFFVAADLLLTARHILADAEYNEDPVIIEVGDASFVCNIEWKGDDTNMIDLAILKCSDFNCCPTPLRLLALPSDRRDIDLTICGYPYENGGGRNQFEIPVTPISNVVGREYDVIAAPTALLSFASYKGFSGSPVLNDSGSVVGVVTDQMNAVLGYKSLVAIVELLAEQGLTCSSNWEMEDNKPYGYRHSLTLLAKQVGLAGDRYNEKYHVDNDRLNRKLERFSDKQHFLKVISKLEEIEGIYTGYASTLPQGKQILDWDNKPYEMGSYINLTYFLQQALKLVDNDPSQKNGVTAQNLRKSLDIAYDLDRQYRELYRCDYIIEGEAGSGKTHMVCRFALHHQSPCYVFLIHGAQLTPSENVEMQICKLCGFPDSTLVGLDEKMATVNKYGIVIIDAINECSSGFYWVRQLDVFRQTFDKYKNLKLIITVRTGTVDIGSWRRETISGFENVNQAVNQYFSAFGVPNEFDWKKFKRDFRNPLFLRLFCDSFRYLNGYWHNDLKQIDVYLAYIKKRNEKISELVDEDIYKNVSEKYLLKIASYSLYYNNCQDISREKARSIGDCICRGRLWSQSLLKNSLDENLLISMPDYECIENEVVGFHFEKMGDFLRAYVLLNSKTDFTKKIDQLMEWQKFAKNHDEFEGKFRGLIGAYIDIYEGKENLLKNWAFKEGPLREYLVEALSYNTKYNKDIIVLLLKSMTPALVRTLVVKFNDLGSEEIFTLHKTLLRMTMPERDAVWSEAINEFCDEYGLNFSRWNFEVTNMEDRQNALVLLSWLLCSSYPEARARLIRQLYRILKEEPKSCIFILKAMVSCDDPYVIEGVLCAVYGVVVQSRDAALVDEIAGLVREMFYGEHGEGPMDLQIRNWTLKILERNHYLTPTSKYFEECTPPNNTPSPFVYLKAKVKADGNEKFFGKTQGSKMLYDSLYGSKDFARYIIGTNSSNTNHCFLYRDRDEEVLLSNIQEMVAQRIMEMGWNDKLGMYDDNRYSISRFDNKKERLGKKYQWLAYYNILGRLTDHCQMKDSWQRRKPYKKLENCYPWRTSETNYFDPTLEDEVKTVGKLLYESPFGIDKENGREWVKNDDKLPSICFEYIDVEGTEWIRLYGYDSETIKQNEYEIEGALFFNSHFVKSEDVDKVIAWAKEKNFYGRWLREAPDMYQFIWNEYPWSDSYTFAIEDGEWEETEFPVKTMLAAIIQLQEDKKGLDTKNYLSNAYLPCIDMMNVLDLYTAERGVVRRIVDDDIVATSFSQLGLENDGIAIKKKYLYEYLEKTGNKLFYFILGEKMAKTSQTITNEGIKKLSACWYMDIDGLHEVQHIAVRTDNPE